MSTNVNVGRLFSNNLRAKVYAYIEEPGQNLDTSPEGGTSGK